LQSSGEPVGTTVSSPALARADWPGPGRHPGHPTAEGGLPASKPGLSAGTRDLSEGSATRARVSMFEAPVSLGGPHGAAVGASGASTGHDPRRRYDPNPDHQRRRTVGGFAPVPGGQIIIRVS